jgi:hypothetical protein
MGANVAAIVASLVSPDPEGLQMLGIQMPGGITPAFVFIVERLDVNGNIVSEAEFKFIIESSDDLTVLSYRSGISTGTDVTTEGGSVSRLNASHLLATAVHTSSFTGYTSSSSGSNSSGNSSGSNSSGSGNDVSGGIDDSVVVLISVLVPIVILLLAGVLCFYYWETTREARVMFEAQVVYATPLGQAPTPGYGQVVYATPSPLGRGML